MIDKFTRLWPIAAVLVAGASGYIRMQIQVSRVEKVPEQIEALNNRITVLETKLSFWEARNNRRRPNE